MTTTLRYSTHGGITVSRTVERVDGFEAVEDLIDRLDHRRGALFSSSYEYPGRYTRWDIGLVDPPLSVSCRARGVEIQALNAIGTTLLTMIAPTVGALEVVEDFELRDDRLNARVRTAGERVPEELRSQQPSVFSVLRAIRDLFGAPEDEHLGLYGAFGYDLAFQFEPIRPRLDRDPDQRDLLLYLPDELVLVDHQRDEAERRRYVFEMDGVSTVDRAGGGTSQRYEGVDGSEPTCDHAAGEYAAIVREAKQAFRRGDLFEVVPGQTFTDPCDKMPSELFRRLRARNPSPYGFLINLGQSEWLVGASPEMYVRVDGDRVETCPISGTIARGDDPIGDAAQILTLLNSDKDASELTMCTDVDRNDKSRVCRPESVRVIGRRQIEMYSRLIHTVDHVEGRLRPGFDALDAFLSHTWAVTVTGAPKAHAMQFLEDHEKSARQWYGGAIGMLGFDGRLNTGLTLRTIQMRDGKASVRVGATLLFESDPDAEEAETRLKASAFLDAIREPRASVQAVPRRVKATRPRRVLLVDHDDSFVHTLAGYFRRAGASVTTWRHGFDERELDRAEPELVVLSPGPGRPSDFGIDRTLDASFARGIAVFGVCLGLQAIVEHAGGRLALLDTPVHGKPATIEVEPVGLFKGMPARFTAGRYHSLVARSESIPEVLQVTARTPDGLVMAVEHKSHPVAGVQFHPESILTLGADAGMHLIANVVEGLR